MKSITQSVGIILCLIINFSNPIFSATLTVCSSGCDHTTIQAAINAASAFDVIQVNDATHTELSITVNKSDLTIQGQGQSTTTVQAHATEGSASDRIFVVNSSITVTIQDLTLRHGNSTGRGGAVLLNTDCAISFKKVTLTNNDSVSDGGAIASASGSSGMTIIMEDCIVSNNDTGVNLSADGGGIYSSGGNLTMTRCSVFNNSCGDDGGGVYSSESGSVNSFTNCVFSGNTAGTAADGSETIDGGGVALFDGTSTMVNCTIASNNSATGMNSSGFGGGVAIPFATFHMTNCIFADNSADSGNGQDMAAQTGSIGTNKNNLCEDCFGGGCPTFSVTSDPGLKTLDDCNGGTLYGHQIDSGSSAENVGTSVGAPSDDLCGNARSTPLDLGATEVGTILPIDLIRFFAKNEGNGVLLNWSTATEINNEGFEIERSKDGENWEYVSFVYGRGNSTTTQFYDFFDANPFEGLNYYRLTQFDFDGKLDHSAIATVEVSNNENRGTISVFPNPVRNGKLSISMAQEIEEGGSIHLYDQLGKEVFSQSIFNQFSTIDLPELPGGFYVWQVKSVGVEQVGKIMIN